MKRHSRTLTVSLVCALAGVAAAFAVQAGFEKKSTQTEVQATRSSTSAPTVQMSARTSAQLHARAEIPHSAAKEQPKLVAQEGAHWAGCEGSLGKAFSEAFLNESSNSKSGFPRTLSSARLQILRSFPAAPVDSDQSELDSSKQGSGITNSTNSTEDSADSPEGGMSEVQRCRVLGKVYAQLNAFVSNFDFAEPGCAENLKRWGVLMADLQCRTWDLLPTLSPLPLLARARLEKCVPADADSCLASFDLRSQNNAEKCGTDATFRASPQAQFTRSRSCFYR